MLCRSACKHNGLAGTHNLAMSVLLIRLSLPSVQGVSIIARRQQPQHVLAFVQVLMVVAGAARTVGQQALEEMRQVATAVQHRWDEQQRTSQQAEEASAMSTSSASSDDVRRFFELRHRQQQAGHPVQATEQGTRSQDARCVCRRAEAWLDTLGCCGDPFTWLLLQRRAVGYT